MAAAAASSSPGAIAAGLLWSKTLTTIPDNFTADQVNKYYAARKTSERNRRRSYKFMTESYVEPSSLETAIVNNGNVSFVVARGQCYASQRKSSKPYRATATIAADGSVSTSTCHCAAKEGLCNHSLALLQMIALLKKEGYREAPLEVTCTELPQQWRRPRGSQINPGSVGDLDWRSVREGGPSEALSSKLYDARKSKRSMTDMQQDLHTLGVDLGHLEDSPFAKHLRSLQVLGTDSMFGIVPEGSGISYQHPVSPHGFKTYISPNIVQCGTDASKPVLPTWPVLFTSSNTYQLETEFLSATKTSLLQSLVLTPEEARQLEKDSRQQAKSATWKAARTNRLTASSFGTVATRESWTNVGLRNLTEERDLSRVRAVKHGVTHEPHAVRNYERALRCRGHSIQTTCCGIMVDPSLPWLGASPDRLVYDPKEPVPHGVLEVKCPYTMYHSADPDSQTFYMVKDDSGTYRLRRDHNFYYQLLGQMALSGLMWGDFVVYCKKFLIVERIRFSLSDWTECKEVLNKFYFQTLLPYLARRCDQ